MIPVRHSPVLTNDLARAMVDAALAAARPGDQRYTIAVVDAGGHLNAFARMDGAPVITIQVATDKAYTAAGFGLATEAWHDLISYSRRHADRRGRRLRWPLERRRADRPSRLGGPDRLTIPCTDPGQRGRGPSRPGAGGSESSDTVRAFMIVERGVADAGARADGRHGRGSPGVFRL